MAKTPAGCTLNTDDKRSGLLHSVRRLWELNHAQKLRSAVVRVWHRLHTPHLSARVIAGSVGVGLAVGLLPVYGLHGAIVLLICVPCRLDSVLAFAVTMISNPVTFPLVLLAELKLGERLLGVSALSVDRLMAGEGWALAGRQLLLGTAVLVTVVATSGTFVAWLLARHWHRKKLAAGLPAPPP